jgi:hypothetical protein
VTYEELAAIAPAWIGYRDTNEVGFHHNISALAVFSLMYAHTRRPPEEKSLDWYVRNNYATVPEPFEGIVGL